MSAVGEAERGASLAEVEALLGAFRGHDLLAAPPTAPFGLKPGEAPPLLSAFPLRRWEAPGYAMLECLALDAVGKAWGVPAHFFFGGAVREAVEADFWCNQPGLETARGLFAEVARLGVRGWKMKAGLDRHSVELARAISAEMGPGFRITIDPMGAWRSPAESASLWQELRGLEAAVQVEDPFAHQHPALWGAVAREGAPPLIWHPRNLSTALVGLEAGFVAGFNFGLPGSGFVYLAGLSEASGRPCWHGSSIELGVLQHYRLHAAAAAPACTLGSDLCSEWVREATLVAPRMQYEGGCALVPSGPGLGIELDESATARYTRAYRSASL